MNGIKQLFMSAIRLMIDDFALFRAGQWCVQKFDAFVFEGEDIPVHKSVSKTYRPVYPDQKEIELKIYCSTSPTVKYISEDCVKLLGTVTLPLPGEGSNRTIEAAMFFGKTTLEFHVTNYMSGQIVRITHLKFDA